MQSNRLSICVLGVLSVCAISWCGVAMSSQTQSSETLRTTTRLVVVDVVATDSKGQPVNDLKLEDFTVLESGQPQKVSGFSFQHPGESRPSTAVPQLPPNVVSNAPHYASSGLNVVLFDAVNGDPTSQAFAKDQLTKFFSGNAALDRPVALFALESQLRLLHDFTVDTAALRSAMDKYSPPAKTNITESFDSRRSPFTTKGDFHTDSRGIETTLTGLNTLAKMMAGYPGRKNLIWLSESFPLVLFPESVLRPAMSAADVAQTADGTGSHTAPVRADPNTFDRMVEGGGSQDYAGMVKKVADALMNAQVAVYPVDAAGVGKNDHVAAQHTMADMASRTGGKVFLNSNNLTASVGASLEDGATYYTLSYYPDNKKWDGQFRPIEIKTSRGDVKLRHRVGYYALDAEKLRKEDFDKVAENLSRMLELDAPAATAVQFQAGVVPPSEKTGNKLLVNFAIDPRTISFERTGDGKEHAKVTCTVWAYGNNRDKPHMSEADTTAADLKPEVYEQVMKKYFPCSRTMELKPGIYTLKLGVLDRTTNLIGTTITTITVR